MRVFVSGTWKREKAAPYSHPATGLGRLLADAGFDLACGPGTGVARFVVDGYRSISPRGKVTYYLPREECMRAVGERVEPGADEIVQTEFDYPMRNVFQVAQCHGLFVLTGGDGALEEILTALIDYRMPVAIIDGAGTAAQAVRLLLDLYPTWREQLIFGGDVHAVAREFVARVTAAGSG
jgi:predicted Rossmann-fold nucleotide-binding protein